MTGEITWFVKVPSPDNATPAVWGLEDNVGRAIDIGASVTCGMQEWIKAAIAYGYPGRALGGAGRGGAAPFGSNPSMAFLAVPVDVPPVYSGHFELDGVSLIVTHNGSLGNYGLRFDSFMASVWRHDGGQIVMNGSIANQKGVWINPRSGLPVDANGPCATDSELRFPSIVGAQGAQRGNGQVLAHIDGSGGVCQALRLAFIEPNGGDFGVCATQGAHGYDSLEIEIEGAHQQYNSCVDLGHGSAAPNGTLLRATLKPGNFGPNSQALDTWEVNGVYEITGAPEGGTPARSITFEAPSKGCRVAFGGPLASLAPTVAPGSGPNYINGTAY